MGTFKGTLRILRPLVFHVLQTTNFITLHYLCSVSNNVNVEIVVGTRLQHVSIHILHELL